jgi:hypothetical protein
MSTPDPGVEISASVSVVRRGYAPQRWAPSGPRSGGPPGWGLTIALCGACAVPGAGARLALLLGGGGLASPACSRSAPWRAGVVTTQWHV